MTRSLRVKGNSVVLSDHEGGQLTFRRPVFVERFERAFYFFFYVFARVAAVALEATVK